MADTKISALPASTTPLAGTEVLPIVQSGTTKKVSVADLTAGRAVATAGGSFTDNITQSTANKGVNFTANTPAAGMTSQLLNWYEEGTWTPVLTASNAPSYTATAVGTYTRIGRQVTVNAYINVSAVSVAGSVVVGFSGLPFTANSSATRFSGVVSSNTVYTTSHVSSVYIIGGQTFGYFWDNSLRQTVNDGLVPGDIWFTITYFV